MVVFIAAEEGGEKKIGVDMIMEKGKLEEVISFVLDRVLRHRNRRISIDFHRFQGVRVMLWVEVKARFLSGGQERAGLLGRLRGFQSLLRHGGRDLLAGSQARGSPSCEAVEVQRPALPQRLPQQGHQLHRAGAGVHGLHPGAVMI